MISFFNEQLAVIYFVSHFDVSYHLKLEINVMIAFASLTI